MSHIAVEYAKNLGVKVGAPVINPHYYPLMSDKFITFHSTNKTQSKDYGFFNEVIDILEPFLKKAGIETAQIGKDSDPFLNCKNNYFGTSVKQTAYILSRSMLHVGVDSMPIHLSSALDTPIIGIYSNMWDSQCGPLWSDKSNIRTFNSPKETPSYALSEDPKTVDKIKAEDVAQAILEKLKIEANINFKTFFIGEEYQGEVSQIIPDFFDKHLPVENIFIRDDLKPDETMRYLEAWCSTRKVVIISDRVLPLNFLKKFAPNIVRYHLNINDNKMSKHIESIKSSGIDLILDSQKQGEELNNIREHYFDYVVHTEKEGGGEDLDLKNKKFFTKKPIFSKDGVFLSKAHWELGKKSLDKTAEIVDNESFRKDLNHFYIYE